MKKVCLLLFCISAELFCAEPDLPRGQIIEKISCLRNASQTYALYLPSRYTPDTKWPVLYALDPGARGLIPVERFREAAEQYGYILAGSNNARNGPVKIVQDAVNALLDDTGARFSIDPKRIYLAGFSGGARGAILAALAAQGRIAGIAVFGAGFPPDTRPARPIPFSLYLAAGVEDFNHPELRKLNRILESLDVPHEFETFTGGHDWPPAPVCTHAIEWLELQGMKSGIRTKDVALVDQLYSKTVVEAELLERNGRLREALERFAAAARGFTGLRDAAGLEARAKELNRVREVRRALATEDEIQTRQETAEEELSRLIASSDSGINLPTARQKLQAAFEGFRRNADEEKDEAVRIASRRVLSRYWILLSEEASLALERREYGRAALRLQAMAWIRPGNPQVYYHLARAYSLGGRSEKALEALRRALANGYRDFETLESSRDLDPLKHNPEYRKLINELKNH